MEYKKLERTPKGLIAGVCGGFAEYFAIDATLMRLIWVALFFAGGLGIFAYLICWIIMPKSLI